MSRVLKRVLTRKSILGFGYAEYRDLSVQMLLDLNKHNLLIDVYYGLEKIDFIPDILDELGITEEFRIIKPSNDRIMRGKFYTHLINNRDEEKYFKIMASNFWDNKKRSKNKEKGDSYKYGSKVYLMNKNHGK